jgi:hypothetical protein
MSDSEEEQEKIQVTEELLVALARTYADPPVCRVCLAPLRYAYSGPDGTILVCSSEDASPLGPKGFGNGTTEEWHDQMDHYGLSARKEQALRPDRHVMAVIGELRSLRKISDINQEFYRLAVKERDYERVVNDRLRRERTEALAKLAEALAELAEIGSRA